MRRNHTLSVLSGAILVTVALACSDSTAPLANRLPGVYELSTVLDSLTYSDYCSLPTSNTSLPVCHDTTVVNSTGALHGLVTLGDTVQGTPTNMMFKVPAGNLEGVICGSCSPSPMDYYETAAAVGRNKSTFQLRLSAGALLILDGTVEHVMTPNGTLLGNEITGRVVWHTYLGCCMVRYYTGTFVLKRQL
jgi:hypothetical protein